MTSSLNIQPLLVTGWLLVLVSGQSMRLQYSFTEENSASFLLGNVAEDSGILNNADHRGEDAQYNFFGPSAQHRDLFEIDSITGDLIVRESVNRDLTSLCAGRISCQVSLDISARFNSENIILGVDVSILDLNDNRPLFNERLISRTLSEGSKVGDPVTLETANDYDSPHFGIRIYEIVQPPPEMFSLRVTNTSGGHYVQIILEVSIFC